MCGRIALFTPPTRLARFVEATLIDADDASFRPSWNLPPTRSLFGATGGVEPDSVRTMTKYHWGLLPSWAKEASFAARTINARAESVAEKPSFRAAFKARRLLIAFDGYYEWQQITPKEKQPHYLTRADGDLVVCAGLYEHWYDPRLGDDAPAMATCSIITTAANADVESVHTRMPAILEREVWEEWLDVDATTGEAALALLRPARTGTVTHHRVDKAVGQVRNDGEGLIEPVPSSQLF